VHAVVFLDFLRGYLASVRAARRRKWLSAEEVGLIHFLQRYASSA